MKRSLSSAELSCTSWLHCTPEAAPRPPSQARLRNEAHVQGREGCPSTLGSCAFPRKLPGLPSAADRPSRNLPQGTRPLSEAAQLVQGQRRRVTRGVSAGNVTPRCGRDPAQRERHRGARAAGQSQSRSRAPLPLLLPARLCTATGPRSGGCTAPAPGDPAPRLPSPRLLAPSSLAWAPGRGLQSPLRLPRLPRSLQPEGSALSVFVCETSFSPGRGCCSAPSATLRPRLQSAAAWPPRPQTRWPLLGASGRALLFTVLYQLGFPHTPESTFPPPPPHTCRAGTLRPSDRPGTGTVWWLLISQPFHVGDQDPMFLKLFKYLEYFL